MGLVNVNCPNCGASVQLSDEQNRAFCMFCGGQIQVQEAIQKFKIDKSGEFENLLMLTKEDLQATNFEMAEQRIQKALEIDTTNPEAWLLNLYAVSRTLFDENGEMVTNFNMAIDEGSAYSSMLRAGENAIKFSNNDLEYRKKVNECYMLRCAANLCMARDVYKEVDFIQARLEELEQICYPGQIAHWGQHEHENIMNQEDDENISMIISWEAAAFGCLSKVDAELLEEKDYEELIDCAETFKGATEAMNIRFGLYNTNISDEHLQWRQEQLNKIYNMIPKAYLESKNITKEELSNEKQTETDWGKLIWSIIISILMFAGFFMFQIFG